MEISQSKILTLKQKKFAEEQPAILTGGVPLQKLVIRSSAIVLDLSAHLFA